jgi:two-component system, OmpR family, phosphate regulon sensor histidine kinase PhoR
MKKQRIWLIIGLMTAALVGIGGVQIYWINYALRLNEEQFDKNALAALNRVADKVQYLENAQVMEALQLSWQSNGAFSEANRNIREAAHFMENGFSERKISKKDSIFPQKRPFEASMNSWEYLKVSQLVDQKPIAERIDLEMLGRSIREELANHGIRIPYGYGVFSKEKNAFVMLNDHFVVIDQSAVITQAGLNNIYSSRYRVPLFTQDIESPGALMIHFPARSEIVFGPLTGILWASIIFTSLVLACFAYTIWVIFRQKKLSEMKNDFINNMTHEFKTPITTINLAADSITSPMILSNPDKIRRFADIIRQENARMNNQVEKVLQMAVIDKKEFDLNLTEINLHQLIEQVAVSFSLQIEKREGHLMTHLEAPNPIIHADLTHLTNIITNLLDNANKYSPEKPEITISTRNESNGVKVTISDRGLGISKDTKKLIFDRFYRVSTGNRHDVKGFGLGLSYVKAMMAAHQGHVEVHSELGRGSSFTLFFPK